MGVRVSYKFSDFKGGLNTAINAGIRDAAFEIERRAVGKAPFKTGNLRNSIGSQSEEGHAIVYADAEYAAYVEQGHGNVAATHFLEESLNEVAPEIPEYIQRHL